MAVQYSPFPACCGALLAHDFPKFNPFNFVHWGEREALAIIRSAINTIYKYTWGKESIHVCILEESTQNWIKPVLQAFGYVCVESGVINPKSGNLLSVLVLTGPRKQAFTPTLLAALVTETYDRLTACARKGEPF